MDNQFLQKASVLMKRFLRSLLPAGFYAEKSVEDYLKQAADSHAHGRLDHAIKAFSKALELNPKDIETYNNRGNAYADKGKFDEAIRDYAKAIQLSPTYADAYNNLGSFTSKKASLMRRSRTIRRHSS